MEETMTVEQVLKITVNILSGIQIPCALTESVGVPISNSIGNLNRCIEAIEGAKERTENNNG